MFVEVEQDLVSDVKCLDSFEQSDDVEVFRQLLLTSSMVVVLLKVWTTGNNRLGAAQAHTVAEVAGNIFEVVTEGPHVDHEHVDDI